MTYIFYCLNEFQFYQCLFYRRTVLHSSLWLLQHNNSYLTGELELEFPGDVLLCSDFRSLTDIGQLLKCKFRSYYKGDLNFALLTSFTYGFHFAFVAKFFNIKWKDIILIDDGLSTYVPIRAKNRIIKILLYNFLGFGYYVPRKFLLSLDSRVHSSLGLFPTNVFLNSFDCNSRRIVMGHFYKDLIFKKNNNFNYLSSPNQIFFGLLLVPDFKPNSLKSSNLFVESLKIEIQTLERLLGIKFLMKLKYSNPLRTLLKESVGFIDEHESVEFLLMKYNVSHVHTYTNTTALLFRLFHIPVELTLNHSYITKDSHESKVKLIESLIP